MRVLLVAAAASPGSHELVSSLAPTHDLVVAVDGGGALCTAAGVKPDVLIGDLDSIGGPDLERLRMGGTEIISFPADKDQTDLELALAHARSRGATSVTVTAASGLRIDHTLAVLGALANAADLQPTLVDPSVCLWVLDRRGCAQRSFCGIGGTLSVVAWGGTCVLTATGVQWPLDHATVRPDSGLGISNVITSERAEFAIHEGTALVIAPIAPGEVRVSAV